jgi:hypothetical protein
MKLPSPAVKRELFRSVGYEPLPLQAEMHWDDHRFRLEAGGERAGKSFSEAMEGYSWWTDAKLIWLVGEEYEDCRMEFDYIADALTKIGALARSSTPMYGPQRLVMRTGGVYKTVSAKRLLKIGREAPDGILVCEAAQIPYSVVIKLFGRAAEKRAPILFSGTFEGSLGWYPDYFNRWRTGLDDGRSFSLPTWSNTISFPGGRDDPEIKALEARYPPDLFMERFGAVPCPPATLVFKEFSYSLHVCEGVIEDGPVELAIDPGYAGAYAVEVLQERDGQVFVIDEVYRRGAVAAEIIAECEERWWWEQVRGGVIDVAGRQHQGLPSHIEIWAASGVYLRSNTVGIEDGINRFRTFLKDPGSGEPRIFFDAGLRGGSDVVGFPLGVLAEFGLYKYPEVGENRPVRELPIDRDNHGLKAIGYWLYDRYGPVERAPVAPSKRREFPWR